MAKPPGLPPGRPFQLNTGKLLSDSYVPQTFLDTTINSVTTTVSTNDLVADRISTGSVIEITMFMFVNLSTVAAATGTEILQVDIIRNDSTTIYTHPFNLVPFASPAAISGLNVPITISFVDDEPSSGTPITGSPSYVVTFTAVGLAAGDSLALGTMNILSFKEIENPTELTLTTPLT